MSLNTTRRFLRAFLAYLNPLILTSAIIHWVKSDKKIPDRETFRNLPPQKKYYVGLVSLLLIGAVLAVGVQFYLANTQTVPARGGEYKEALIGAPRFINPALAPTNDVDRDISS